MDRDLYDILGISRSASRDEIKRAFRRLARTYHPDFNPGDKIAERHFREAQQAYEILSDDETRRSYDRFGMSYFRRRSGAAPPRSPKSMLNDMIESMLKRELNPRRRGDDLRYHLTISLEEACEGTERTLSFERELGCELCRGTGAEGSEGKRPCTACEGLGELRPSSGFFTFRRPCSRCRATGYEIVVRCTRCGGKGRHGVSEQLKLRIPPGVDVGQRLRVKDRGNEGQHGGSVGDLYVVIHVKEHGIFRRQGAELLCDIPVDAALAAQGGDLTVPTLHGSARIRIPPGVQSGRLFRLRSLGMPRANPPGRGDLHVRIQVTTSPGHHTEAQRSSAQREPASGQPGPPRSSAGGPPQPGTGASGGGPE